MRSWPALFETERLRVRAWTLAPADVVGAFAVFGDPEVTRYLARHEPDLASQRRGLARLIERMRGFPAGQGWFALERREGGALVGCGLLKPLEDVGPEVELGYHLARAHWGQGYATEVGRGLLAHGFGTLGLERIVALVDPRNARSLAVVRRLGMAPAGRQLAHGRECLKFAADAPATRPAARPGSARGARRSPRG